MAMGAMNPRAPTLRCCACTCSRCNHGPAGTLALLRQPPISALAMQGSAQPVPPRVSRAPATVVEVQVSGQLGLVLTLDGVTLCVVPLGPCAEPVHDAVVA